MNQEIKRKWLEALRSGKYEQGKGFLRKTDNTYCCVGVLCDVVAPDLWSLPYGSDHYTHSSGHGSIIPEYVENKCGIDNTEIRHLYPMNDYDQKTFSQIADYIETTL